MMKSAQPSVPGQSLNDLEVAIQIAEAEVADTAEPTQEQVDRLRALISVERNKVDAIGAVLVQLKASAEACEMAATALLERAGRFMRRRGRLEAYVKAVMESGGRTKVEGDLVTLTVVAGRERVEIENPAEFVQTARDQFVRIVPERLEPDKTAISKALKAGDEVPGATLVIGETSLRVYR